MPFTSVLGASTLVKPGVATSTTRPSNPYTGQAIYETDTAKISTYNGSAWVYTAAGALVRVGGGALSGTSTTINNVFSTTYRAYLIVVSGVLSGVNTNLRLVDSGGTVATTNYKGVAWQAPSSGGAESIVSTPTTRWEKIFYDGGSTPAVATINLGNPFETTGTAITVFAGELDYSKRFTGGHSTASSYTGVSFISDGTFSAGLVNIYGYSLS